MPVACGIHFKDTSDPNTCKYKCNLGGCRRVLVGTVDVAVQTVVNTNNAKREHISRRLISGNKMSNTPCLHVAAIWEALQDGVLTQEEEHQIIPYPGQQQLPRRRPDDVDCRVGKCARNSLNAQELALGLRTRYPTPEGEDIAPRIVSLSCRVSTRVASLQPGYWGTCSKT